MNSLRRTHLANSLVTNKESAAQILTNDIIKFFGIQLENCLNLLKGFQELGSL